MLSEQQRHVQETALSRASSRKARPVGAAPSLPPLKSTEHRTPTPLSPSPHDGVTRPSLHTRARMSPAHSRDAGDQEHTNHVLRSWAGTATAPLETTAVAGVADAFVHQPLPSQANHLPKPTTLKGTSQKNHPEHSGAPRASVPSCAASQEAAHPRPTRIHLFFPSPQFITDPHRSSKAPGMD